MCQVPKAELQERNCMFSLDQTGKSRWLQGEGAAAYFWDSPALVITSGVKTAVSTGQFIIPHFKPVLLDQGSNSDHIWLIITRDFGRVMANCLAEFTHIPVINPSFCLKLSLSLTYCLLMWIFVVIFLLFCSLPFPFLCIYLQVGGWGSSNLTSIWLEHTSLPLSLPLFLPPSLSSPPPSLFLSPSLLPFLSLIFPSFLIYSF